jgi:hypothetical protein
MVGTISLVSAGDYLGPNSILFYPHGLSCEPRPQLISDTPRSPAHAARTSLGPAQTPFGEDTRSTCISSGKETAPGRGPSRRFRPPRWRAAAPSHSGLRATPPPRGPAACTSTQAILGQDKAPIWKLRCGGRSWCRSCVRSLEASVRRRRRRVPGQTHLYCATWSPSQTPSPPSSTLTTSPTASF